MNMQLMGLLSKYPKLMALTDLAGLRSNQLTTEHLARIADAFGVKLPITPEIADAVVALLKGHNVQVVADMIRSPESIQDLVVFFTNGFKGLQELRMEHKAEFTAEAAQLYIS